MNFTVAITGMNARADNPGPGYAVARCLQESPDFLGRVVGLGYDVLDAGLYHPHCQASYLLPYPSAGDSALLERLLCIHEQEALDAVIPCLDPQVPFPQGGTLAGAGLRRLEDAADRHLQDSGGRVTGRNRGDSGGIGGALNGLPERRPRAGIRPAT